MPAVHPAWPTASRCSPASGPTASTSTSGPSSTSAILRPFEQDHTTFGLEPTPASARWRPASTRRPASTSTASPSRCPSSELSSNGHNRAGGHRVAHARSSACGPRPAARRPACATTDRRANVYTGPYVQVSRLGQPAGERGADPHGKKDYWNAQPPASDSQFAVLLLEPRAGPAPPGPVPRRLPQPGRLQRTTGTQSGRPPRHPPHRHPDRGSSPGSRTSRARPRPTCCDSTWPSRRRRARPTPDCSATTSAGFPNGRRVFDDVVTIELRAWPARR